MSLIDGLILVQSLFKRVLSPLNLYINWYPTRPFLAYAYIKALANKRL